MKLAFKIELFLPSGKKNRLPRLPYGPNTHAPIHIERAEWRCFILLCANGRPQ